MNLYKVTYTLYETNDEDDDLGESSVHEIRLALEDPDDDSEIHGKIGDSLGQHFPDISIDSIELIGEIDLDRR